MALRRVEGSGLGRLPARRSFDEITYPINWGWIPIAEVLEAIRSRPSDTNVSIASPAVTRRKS